jgi:hypothetical protein
MYPVYNKFYYKPLPDCIEVKKSPIEGFGLFLNHSENSNCYLCEQLDWDDYRVYNVITSKKISVGEELTLNYHLDGLNYGKKETK